MRFLKGNVERDFVSLFYIFDHIILQKMKFQRMPIMQLTMDRTEKKYGKQIIRLKMANFASLGHLSMIIGINLVWNLRTPFEPTVGILLSIIIYLFGLGYYSQQLEQFKEELKLIELKLAEKKKAELENAQAT